MTSNRDDRIRAYRKLIELYPKLSFPHASLSLLFLEDGNVRDGIDEFKSWLGLEGSPAIASTYVRSGVELLAQKGCVVPNHEKWFSILLEIRLRSESGNDDVREQAKLDFRKTKQKLLDALNRTQCPQL